MPDGFFLDDMNDDQVMKWYAKIIQWAFDSDHYNVKAKNEFAAINNADAFIVAVAKCHDYIIVTQEQGNAETKRRIPIPTVADSFNVPSMQIFDLLSSHASATFKFEKAVRVQSVPNGDRFPGGFFVAETCG